MNNGPLQYQLVVVGAGPAGIAAACVAAEHGRSVAVVDNTPRPGGQIWRAASAHSPGRTARHWLRRLEQCGVRIFQNATVFATPSPGLLLAETPEGVLELRWEKLVLATGARERFIPFPGWTLPGVMGVGGLQTLAKSGWPVAGKRIVIAGSGPLLLAAAQGLKAQGARVSLVAEQAPWGPVMRFGAGLLRHPGKLAQAVALKASLLGVPYRCGWWPVKAEGATQVEGVVLTNGSRTVRHECDYLACAFDLIPNLELPRLLGCKVVQGFVNVDEFQRTSVAGVFCAGEPTGISGADCALVEGQVAALAAMEEQASARALFPERAVWHQFRAALKSTFALRSELRRMAAPDTILCRCEDVRVTDLKPYQSWRAAKLHTRCGMGPCQGRTCGAAAEFLFGWENDAVRPPLFPVRMASLAGESPSPKVSMLKP